MPTLPTRWRTNAGLAATPRSSTASLSTPSTSANSVPGHALWGLLHDASEAYLVDLPRPLKQLPEFAPYREAERRLQRAVVVRFGLPPDQPATVTEADDTMLWIEAHSLLGSMPVEVFRDTRPPFEITEPLLPVEAERLFLARLRELNTPQSGLPNRAEGTPCRICAKTPPRTEIRRYSNGGSPPGTSPHLLPRTDGRLDRRPSATCHQTTGPL